MSERTSESVSDSAVQRVLQVAVYHQWACVSAQILAFADEDLQRKTQYYYDFCCSRWHQSQAERSSVFSQTERE